MDSLEASSFIGGMKSAMDQAFPRIFSNPPMPRFPKLSMFSGCFASWFYSLLVWLGLPPGPLGGLLSEVWMRGLRAAWAMKTTQERMIYTGFAAIHAGAALSMGTYPPGRLK